MPPRRCEQMYMVCHQHERVHIDVQSIRMALQRGKIAQTIVVAEEAGAAIIASLHDVLRDMRQINPAAAWHGDV